MGCPCMKSNRIKGKKSNQIAWFRNVKMIEYSFKKSIQTALEAGIIKEQGVIKIQDVPIALVLL